MDILLRRKLALRLCMHGNYLYANACSVVVTGGFRFGITIARAITPFHSFMSVVRPAPSRR